MNPSSQLSDTAVNQQNIIILKKCIVNPPYLFILLIFAQKYYKL